MFQLGFHPVFVQEWLLHGNLIHQTCKASRGKPLALADPARFEIRGRDRSDSNRQAAGREEWLRVLQTQMEEAAAVLVLHGGG